MRQVPGRASTIFMDIHDSLQLILQAKDQLAGLFYERFLADYPEVRPFFEKVDFARQRVLLTTTLMIIERNYTEPTPAIEQYLQYLGNPPSRDGNPPQQLCEVDQVDDGGDASISRAAVVAGVGAAMAVGDRAGSPTDVTRLRCPYYRMSGIVAGYRARGYPVGCFLRARIWPATQRTGWRR